MSASPLTLKGRVVQHNTKAATKDGVDILKVTFEVDSLVGGEAVKTQATVAVRYDEDTAERFPLDGSFELTIKPTTK